MTTELDFESPVHLQAVAAENLPAVTPALEDLYRGFEKELLIPLWTEIGDLMPLAPAVKGGAAPVALGQPARARGAGGRARPGGPRRRAPRDRARQPRPERPPVRHADAVGGDPVPDAGGERARAPAHAARLPLRARGRGRLDGRRRRPGGDAPRRLPAAGRLELARAPQRDAGADGLDRRPGHPAAVHHRGAVLRVRPGRGQRRGEKQHRSGRGPSACGATRASSRSRRPHGRKGRAARCSPTAGSRPTGHSPTSWRSKKKATKPPSSPATPPSATPIRPRDRTCSRRSAPSSTASPGTRRPPRSGKPGRASTRSSTAQAPSPSATRPGRWAGATCSSCRPGSRSPPGQRRGPPTQTAGRSTCSASATPRSSRH